MKNILYVLLLCLCSLSWAGTSENLLSKIKQLQKTRLQKGVYSLIFYGDDYISGGKFRAFDHDSRLYHAHGSKHYTNFSLNDYDSFDVDFSAAYDDDLEIKTYENALRYPFNGKSRPGLDFGGDGRGCNQLEGRFTILEQERDAQGNLKKFAANFEQHCEKGARSDFGAVRFNSSLPVVPNPAIKLNGTITIPLVKLDDGKFSMIVLQQTENNPSQFSIVTILPTQPNKTNYDIPASFEKQEHRFVVPSVIQINPAGEASEYEIRFLENPSKLQVGDILTLDKLNLIR